MSKGNRKIRWLVAGAVAVGLGTVVLVATGVITLPGREKSAAGQATAAKSAGKEAPAVMVTVAPVALKAVKRSVDSVGTFQGFEEVTVTPKVSGRAVKIHHDVQDVVHTGDLLLEIDPTDYQLAVDEARKTLDAELAKIGLTALPPEKLDKAKFLQELPAYRRAVNVERNAQSKLERAKGLRGGNALSQEELEQTATDCDVAVATRQQVELDALATLSSARQKQALLATAQQHLTDTKVEVPAPKEAPADGQKTEYVVAKRMVSEGEMIIANMFIANGVYRLVIHKTLKLQAPVPERYASQIVLDQDVEIGVDSYPGRVFPGKVRRISPTVDPASRTFLVEIHVPNEHKLLKAGGFAKLAIITQRDAKAQAVPLESLVSFAGINKVFVIRDGKAHAVEVALGVDGKDADGSRWLEVTAKQPSELSAGTPVITSGQTQLAEDVKVRLREAVSNRQ